MEYFLAAIVAIILIFILLHLRPLTKHEISSLSIKRRMQDIENFFNADNTERTVNPEFKKSLNPRGTFYNVNLSLYETASTISGLLKYKKHEWIVIAFLKNKEVDKLWVNKGHDNSSSSIYLPVIKTLEIANKEGYSTILMFHNHPNSNPSKYDCTSASKTDLDTASDWAKTLNPGGVNLLKYICERGQHYRYFLAPSESFRPLCNFIEEVNATNGRSIFNNLQLHIERIF